MKQILDSVWEYAQKNPYGFTINIETLQPVKYGICVAYLETQNSFGKQGLKRAIEHALHHQKIVGGWLSPKGSYFFDSVKTFKNSELDQAIAFAKQNEQLAIFDLTNLREIIIK